jgi:glycosyltransferase involved in cell wall biosynthesis
MRICIDVRHKIAGGGQTFMVCLVRELLRAGSDHEFILLELEGTRLLKGIDYDRMECPAGSALAQYHWVQKHLPRQLRERGVDIYHSLKHVGPFRAECRLVYSLSSLGGFCSWFSGAYPLTPTEWIYWGFLCRRWLHRLDWLITNTPYIGEYIASRFHYPADRITTVPYGRDEAFGPVASGNGESPFAGPYLLNVANVFPVKNTATLIRAFGQLAGRHPDLRLVVCGNQSHRYFRKTRDLAASLGVGQRVLFKGFASKDELLGLYPHAAVFVLPSLQEGFPMALVEAMACGAACVTSDRPGLRELGSDAVIQYSPAKDPDALAAALDRVLTDPRLRRDLGNRAIRRVAGYSWNESARQTLAVYDRFQ